MNCILLFVFYCILLSAFLGGHIGYKNVHGVPNKILITFLRMRELKERNGLFSLVRCFRYFFPGMRNDVLLVIQDLGSRSVTSDFHARSQTIPCEICDRCHRERFCVRNTSLPSRTPSLNKYTVRIDSSTTDAL